ncbi:MAG: archaeosine synthase subunit alpha [Thermoplasmata archaeon]
MIETIKRDWLARIGNWSLLENTVETPNILFHQSERIRPPETAEVLLLSEAAETDRPFVLDAGSVFLPSEFSGENVIPPDLGYPMGLDEINVGADGDYFSVLLGGAEELAEHVRRSRERVFVLGNAAEMLRHPLDFVKRVVAVKSRMSPHGLIYAPGIATPSNLSVLVYCGVDLVDSLRVIMESRYGRFHTERGSMPLEETRRKICHCPACEEGISRKNLTQHNFHALMRELHVCKNSIERGKMRELAERRMLSSPWCVSVIRHLDRRFYDAVEPSVPITGGEVLALSDASLYRPDILRFRKRMLERYSKPPSAKILLLLPCSARKPYSRSRSHRIFKRAVGTAKNRYLIHEVTVTSPLGLVPRELELFYPAQNYDIPVTGDWSGEERNVVREELRKFLRRNQYSQIVAHLGVEKGFLADMLENAVFTAEDSPTSATSMEALKEALSEATKDLPAVNRKARHAEDLKNLAVFQFGEAGGDLVKDCETKGRYPHIRIIGDEHLATLVPPRGMFSLTLGGGRSLARNEAYCVEIEDFRPEGNVFAVGVRNANPNIREGDDVVVVHEDEVRAVGLARMSAREMTESRRGEAVRVRHRA